jgi:hypothetical protein
MTEPEHKINGPVYASWDEAMADPNLDLSKPWYVAPDADQPDSVFRASLDAGGKTASVSREWPDGWQTLEPIDETKPLPDVRAERGRGQRA